MPGRVLVVEDSATQADALCLLLEDAGYDVALARSGEAALEQLAAQAFDIVVSDVVMPGISGYDLCRRIKDDAGLRDTPVLLLTTLNDPMDIVRGLEAGADNYLTKPYEGEQLLARIRRVLDNRRLRGSVRTTMGVNIEFLGSSFTINSDREQILDLLLSSVEDIVRTNHVLEARQSELARAHRQLEVYAREKALEAQLSTERLQALMRNASDAIFLLDEEGVVLEANVRAAELMGRPLEELIWRRLVAFLEPAGGPVFEEGLRYVRQHRTLPPRDGIIVGADGVQRYIEYSASATQLDGQEFILGIARDVTAQRAGTEKLRRSERLLAEAQHIAGLGSWEWWLDDDRVQCSTELGRLIGVTLDSFGVGDGDALLERVHPDDRERVQTAVKAALKDGRPLSFEFRFRGPEDRLRIGHVRGELVRDEEGKPVRVVGSLQDITDRKRAERLLMQREMQFRTVIEAAPIGICEYDPQGIVRIWNPEAERMYGWSSADVVGRPAPHLGTPDHADFLRTWNRTLSGERLVGEELTRHRWDGTPVHISLSTAPIRGVDDELLGVIAVFADVSERKKAEETLRRTEEQLRHAQRMEAIGRLTGGIAHDFNNMLTAMKGGTELLLLDLPPDSPMREELEEIDRAATRAAALTRQLLAFSRTQVLKPQVVDMNHVVGQLDRMLRRLLGEDVILTTQLAQDIGPVVVDPGQLEQVLLNLVVNARDAMPGGGSLVIATSRESGDDQRDQVVLRVSDTGAGIPPDVREHIFEPFFTTKEVGKGTGLGLSTVYGIVAQSGGSIEADSTPGEGTTFTVRLPALSPGTELPQAAASPIPATAADGQAGGACTILLVEDEEAVRRLAARVLRKHGYTVLEAATGPDALSVAAAHPESIALVLSDLIMPGMSGREVAEELQRRHSGVRVLFMSGYSPADAESRFAAPLDHPLLEKPFTVNQLLERVREVLGQ